MLQLPSCIRGGGPKYIRMPQTEKVVESDEEWAKCGKWILQNPEGDLSWTDKVWTDLQELLQKGVLIMLKASTAVNRYEKGVVLCFTGPGKETAKKAAEEIRRKIHYEYAIFYKSNKMTDSNVDHRFGHKCVTKYMHTFRGRFYVRDTLMRWKLDEDDKEEQNLFYKRNLCYFELETLPSRSAEQQLKYQLTSCSEAAGSVHARCSLEEDENGLTETDRVWVVVKKMYDGGRFTKIHCLKSPEFADIFCYVSDYSDINSLMEICDDIFEISGYESFMYFRSTDETKFGIVQYTYTAKKELYEIKNEILKFLLEKRENGS